MDYLLHLAIMLSIYIILTTSVDLLVGHAGILTVAHASCWGIGAYTSAILSVHWGISALAGVALAMCNSMILFVAFCLLTRHLRGDEFVLATLSFQLVVQAVFRNWATVTNGPFGIGGIPALLNQNGQALRLVPTLVTYGTIAALTSLYFMRLLRTPYGRVLRAVRDDEVFARSLGKNATAARLQACALSAALAGLSGGLYAHYARFIDPTPFDLSQSIVLVAMVTAGGPATRLGPVLAAAVLLLLPELLRLIGMRGARMANGRDIVYGVLLTSIVALFGHKLRLSRLTSVLQ